MHPDGEVDPARDAAALELELVFHDLELVETRLERIANSMKKGIGEGLEAERDVLQNMPGTAGGRKTAAQSVPVRRRSGPPSAR